MIDSTNEMLCAILAAAVFNKSDKTSVEDAISIFKEVEAALEKRNTDIWLTYQKKAAS